MLQLDNFDGGDNQSDVATNKKTVMKIQATDM